MPHAEINNVKQYVLNSCRIIYSFPDFLPREGYARKNRRTKLKRSRDRIRATSHGERGMENEIFYAELSRRNDHGFPLNGEETAQDARPRERHPSLAAYINNIRQYQIKIRIFLRATMERGRDQQRKRLPRRSATGQVVVVASWRRRHL